MWGARALVREKVGEHEDKGREEEPLTEEIRLQIFGFPELPDFQVDLLRNGDSVYSRENLFEILGIPENTCLICMGTSVKSCQKFWHT